MLSDRFVDSSLAYQGGAGGFGIETVRAINAFGIGETFPDRTLVLRPRRRRRTARCTRDRDEARPDRRALTRVSPQSGDCVPLIAAEEPRARAADRCVRLARPGDRAVARRNHGPLAVIIGQERAVEQFASAWASRKLHHAWLLAGPKGVGKAIFAHAAARRVLADAAGPPFGSTGDRDARRPSDRQADRGRQPSGHALARTPAEGEERRASRATSPFDQVRGLGEFMGMTAALSPWRVAVIDSIDELEPRGVQRAAQNARGAAARTRSSSSSAMRRAACFRPSVRAAAGLSSRASTMTP